MHVVHVIAHEAKESLALQLAPQLDAEYSEANNAIESLLASDVFRVIARTATVERGNVEEVLTTLAEKKHVGNPKCHTKPTAKSRSTWLNIKDLSGVKSGTVSTSAPWLEV